jgi:hypothetical protein
LVTVDTQLCCCTLATDVSCRPCANGSRRVVLADWHQCQGRRLLLLVLPLLCLLLLVLPLLCLLLLDLPLLCLLLLVLPLLCLLLLVLLLRRLCLLV